MRAALVLAMAAAALSACSSSTKAPFDPGVCYSVTVAKEGGAAKFNIVAEDQPQIEFCAARLEEMRLRFLRLGGTNRDVIGAYQGQFIFIDRGGVSFGRTLEGGRFFALARTGDGRLAIPGAIQRDIDVSVAGAAPTVAAPPAK